MGMVPLIHYIETLFCSFNTYVPTAHHLLFLCFSLIIAPWWWTARTFEYQLYYIKPALTQRSWYSNVLGGQGNYKEYLLETYSWAPRRRIVDISKSNC